MYAYLLCADQRRWRLCGDTDPVEIPPGCELMISHQKHNLADVFKRRAAERGLKWPPQRGVWRGGRTAGTWLKPTKPMKPMKPARGTKTKTQDYQEALQNMLMIAFRHCIKHTMARFSILYKGQKIHPRKYSQLCERGIASDAKRAAAAKEKEKKKKVQKKDKKKDKKKVQKKDKKTSKKARR